MVRYHHGPGLRSISSRADALAPSYDSLTAPDTRQLVDRLIGELEQLRAEPRSDAALARLERGVKFAAADVYAGFTVREGRRIGGDGDMERFYEFLELADRL